MYIGDHHKQRKDYCIWKNLLDGKIIVVNAEILVLSKYYYLGILKIFEI